MTGNKGKGDRTRKRVGTHNCFVFLAYTSNKTPFESPDSYPYIISR